MLHVRIVPLNFKFVSRQDASIHTVIPWKIAQHDQLCIKAQMRLEKKNIPHLKSSWPVKPE